MSTLAETTVRKLGGDWYGNYGLVQGPGHSKKDRSLQVSQKHNDPDDVVLFSHAGDNWATIKQQWRAQGLLPARKMNGSRSAFQNPEWFYHDESGQAVAKVIRTDKTDKNGDKVKKYSQERLENGKWIKKGIKAPKPLYRRHLLVKNPGTPILVTEGEKDADAARKLFPTYETTTSMGGCGQAALTDWSPIKGRDVTIWPDNDQRGAKYARDVATLCKAAGASSVKIVDVPSDWHKGWGLADLLPPGVTMQTLADLLSDAGEVSNETTAYQTLTPITLENFLSLDLKPQTFVLSNLIHEGGIVMIYAWRGVGKTWFAVALGYSIASGGQYLKWKAEKPRHVLHVCGEMPAVALRERIAMTVTGQESGAAPDYYRVLSSDLHEMGIPDLASREGQAAFDEVIGDAEVILLDNASTLFRSGRENEAESWLLVQPWLLKLRRQGRTVIIIHHAGKGGDQRGTSRREDVLDLVLNLRTPSDYDPVEGARFEIHFEKHRGLMGKDVDPFEVKLEKRDDKTVWIMRDLEDTKLADIQELKEQGRTYRQIAAELGLSKSAVERALKKGREQG